MKPGVLYNFTLRLDGHNASGAFWSGSVHDTASRTSTPVGTLFMPHVGGAVGFGTLGATSNMFLEYFAGGDCEAVHVGVGSFGEQHVDPTAAAARPTPALIRPPSCFLRF